MQALFSYSGLKNYDNTVEGARKFLSDHEKDETVQNILKQAKDELKLNRPDFSLESFVQYSINLNRENAMIHQMWEKNNFMKNFAELEMGLKIKYQNTKYHHLAAFFNRDSTVSDRVKAQLGEFARGIDDSDPLFDELDEPIEKELGPEDLDMEKDLMLVKFVQEFYRKYSLVYSSDLETEKASKLKVRVRLENNRFVHLTRNELDDNVTLFRQIYSSFCSLRKFLERSEVDLFEQGFSVSCYFSQKSDSTEKLNLHPNPFTVVWTNISTTRSKPDDKCTQYIKTRIFDPLTVGILKDHFDRSYGDDIILHYLCKKHYHFIDFILRLYMSKLPQTKEGTPMEQKQ